MVAPLSAVSRCVMSRSPKNTLPSSGSVRPQIILMSVVFPAPVGPRMQRYSPDSTFRSMPSAAISEPNLFFRPSSLISVMSQTSELPAGGIFHGQHQHEAYGRQRDRCHGRLVCVIRIIEFCELVYQIDV